MASSEFQFAATLKKLAVTVAHEKGEDGETVDVPRLTVTLELTNPKALGVNARLSGYHGNELIVVVNGYQAELRL